MTNLTVEYDTDQYKPRRIIIESDDEPGEIPDNNKVVFSMRGTSAIVKEIEAPRMFIKEAKRHILGLDFVQGVEEL